MRIVALKQRQATAVEKMDGLLATAQAEDNRDMTAEEQAQFEALNADAVKLGASIKQEEALLALKAQSAAPIATLPGGVPAGTVPAVVAEKGLRFARMTRALAAAKGIPIVANQIAESWGDSGLFANQNMGSGAAGGFMVAEDVSSEIIELLRPQSVIMSTPPIIMPMTSGNMTMNRQATGANAGYIGEQAPPPATAISLGQVKLSAKKLAALIPISNDLIRATSNAADRVVRDDLVMSLATRTDLAFIRGSGTEFSPRGLRFQNVGFASEATNILAFTAGQTLATVTADLGRMELALLNADVPVIRPCWLMAPRTYIFLMNLRDGNGNFAFPEVANMMLRAKPIKFTTQIPTNLNGAETELYLVDFGHVVVGEHMGLEIAMSTEAAYVDVNSTMQAAFSRDETVMRAIQQHDIGLRHLPAVAVLTGVTWA